MSKNEPQDKQLIKHDVSLLPAYSIPTNLDYPPYHTDLYHPVTMYPIRAQDIRIPYSMPPISALEGAQTSEVIETCNIIERGYIDN